jgi:hypothetical protein
MVFCFVFYNTIIYINVDRLFLTLKILFIYFCLHADFHSYQVSGSPGE